MQTGRKLNYTWTFCRKSMCGLRWLTMFTADQQWVTCPEPLATSVLFVLGMVSWPGDIRGINPANTGPSKQVSLALKLHSKEPKLCTRFARGLGRYSAAL